MPRSNALFKMISDKYNQEYIKDICKDLGIKILILECNEYELKSILSNNDYDIIIYNIYKNML